ncbi:hypothetical protein ACFXGI_12055 [Streptomyces sp. NPDC059355]|uniref:hypothetical protein n=1 Tax=Streptomyces sp. NPDC059355 TaxID=3346811 RepID=UPI0036965FDD
MMEMQAWREAWERATVAAESLRAAFAGLGLPESAWGRVRPSVTHAGRAYVDLGTLPAEAAERIAEALSPERAAQ